ncbi:hypothetical protein BJ170DRAFT_483125 [Xylariales sp. AK1849]|nr:hypothetical protein BJ170DRAFT_483125 [Xylariales sp. AK1849]
MAPVAHIERTCVSCDAVDGKYKCPRCLKYTCSLACSTKHREDHVDEESKATLESTYSPSVKSFAGDGSEVLQGTPSSATSFSNDTVAQDTDVDDSDEPDQLKMLFRKYPLLRSQLRHIAAATDPPSTVIKNNNSPDKFDSRKKMAKPWNRDIGNQTGVEALRRALQKDHTGGLQEYCELAKILNARKDQENADVVFRRKLAERDAELIGQLIREERD